MNLNGHLMNEQNNLEKKKKKVINIKKKHPKNIKKKEHQMNIETW
jgi:hypothetical protein